MSKRNYSQYSKNNNNQKAEEATISVVDFDGSAKIKMEYEPAETSATFGYIEPVVDAVETVTLPKTVIGTVVGCHKLNIRSKPFTDAAVLVVVNADSKIEIDPARSTSDWLKVVTPTGENGYCMRRFVDAKL